MALIDLFLGPIQIGSSVSTLLFGVSTAQAKQIISLYAFLMINLQSLATLLSSALPNGPQQPEAHGETYSPKASLD